MEKLRSAEDLMEHISKMNSDNSVSEVFIPGIGRFTIAFQEEEQGSIEDDVKETPELGEMIYESLEAYRDGKYKTTSELLESISAKK